MIDFEKSEKLPRERRYFNISIIWIFYFRLVIRLLYHLKIPHELVTLLSIGLGLYSAGLFYEGRFLPAALTLHLKDIFDASDGALARLTGRGHLIGRYLDSLGDFFALTAVMTAISLYAFNTGNAIYLIWGGLAIFSTFIQCSFFNYYQLKYIESFGIKTLSSSTDENNRSDLESEYENKWARILLTIMRFFYKIIFSWQDRLVESVENRLNNNLNLPNSIRYANKNLMIAQSALCFGTHIFVIILAAVIGRPEYSLMFITVAMNIYLIVLLYLRRRYYESQIQKMNLRNNSERIQNVTDIISDN